MAYEIPGFKLGTLKANSDLSTDQYHFAKVVGAALVDLVTTSGGVAMGVIQNKPASGENVELMVTGVTKVVAGAAVDAATEPRVMSDTTGRAITAATTGSKIQGVALESATAAGQLIAVLLLPSIF